METLDVSIIDIYNAVHGWVHGAYVSDSIMLLSLALVDTVLAVGWRIKKGRPIWSNTLKGGLLFNVVLSFLPQLVGVAYNVVHEPNNLLMFVVECLTIFIALAQLQSIFANAVLFGIKVPGWLMKYYKILIEPEVEKKEAKSEGG